MAADAGSALAAGAAGDGPVVDLTEGPHVGSRGGQAVGEVRRRARAVGPVDREMYFYD